MVNQNYSEIRNAAARLAWVLSGEIKNINARNSVFLADKVNLVGEAVNYLLSIACDDWSEIKGTTAEIDALGLSSIICDFDEYGVGDRWHSFIKMVADEEGCAVPCAKEHDPLPTVSKELFISIGIDLGYLSRQKKLIGNSKWVVLD